jgi:hypothetical protein
MAIKELSLSWAYAFADRVIQQIRSPEAPDCVLDFLDPEDRTFRSKVEAPCRDTLLHDFIRNIHLGDFDYSTGHSPELATDTYASVLDAARIPRPPWLTPRRVERHIRELDRLLAHAIGTVAEGTFHLLFSDREFLASFQDLVAQKIGSQGTSNGSGHHGDLVIRRPNRLPSWLRKAVFFRDKGRCQLCFSDLTGVLALDPHVHLDHMRPLAQYGSNDPTNFQLLCDACNLRKGNRTAKHVFRTFTYW